MSRIQQIEKDILRLGAHLQVANDTLLVPTSLSISFATPLWLDLAVLVVFALSRLLKLKQIGSKRILSSNAET